jgi:outer membrane protein assembly factor BamB
MPAVEELVRDLKVGGPAVDLLKDAIDTAPDSTAADAFVDRVDDLVSEERKALRGVRALYGDLAVSADGDTAYVATYGGWLFALDIESGATRWITELDPMVGGVLAEPDRVYAGTKDGKLYALAAADGSIVSERKLDDEIWAAPTAADEGGGIFVPTLGGSLYRLTDTLDVTWKFDDAGGAIAQRPVVGDDRVYVGSFDSTLYAISTDTGHIVWDIEADNWFWGEPVLQEGTLYAPSLDGKVYAVDAQTGEPRWQRPYDTDDQVRSGLALSRGALMVGSRDGFVHKVSLDDGARVGDPLRVGSRLESDLKADEDGNVYAISRNPVLYVIETGDTLSAQFYDLPD